MPKALAAVLHKLFPRRKPPETAMLRSDITDPAKQAGADALAAAFPGEPNAKLMELAADVIVAMVQAQPSLGGPDGGGGPPP